MHPLHVRRPAHVALGLPIATARFSAVNGDYVELVSPRLFCSIGAASDPDQPS